MHTADPVKVPYANDPLAPKATLAVPGSVQVPNSSAQWVYPAGPPELVPVIVYVAELTPESDRPVFVAMAFTVVVLAIEIGAVYVGEDEVGVLPSVVNLIVAPSVVELRVTVSADGKVPPPGLKVGAAAVVRGDEAR